MASSKLREQVTKRAKGCCEYCMSQEKYSSSPFSIEHIIPSKKDGSNKMTNLALACQGCNNHKYIKLTGIDPKTQNIVKLFHPRKDEWNLHFEWNENYTVVIGKTPKGRASIVSLKLNRPFLINQRIVYRAYGVHPPAHSL